jgi:hypothetical protein
MKGKSIPTLLLSLFIFFILFLPAYAIAGGEDLTPPSVGDPACDPECNCRPDHSICPIDSYVYVLLGIGVLYGAWKVKERKEVVEE